MTRMHLSSQPWSGRDGRLNGDVIKEAMPAWTDAVYCIAGPPPMVATMSAILDELETR